LTAPLLVVGVLSGHALGYRWTVADAHEQTHVLEASGHGYLAYAPLVVALGLSVVVVAFLARVRAILRGGTDGELPPWVFALLAPLAFLAQEYVERLVHSSEVAWATVLEPPVVAGLLLQLPVALVVLAVARALARLADAVGRALGAEPREPLAELLLPCPVSAAALPVPRIAGRGRSERGPPSISC
jgi:hypothetical protein